VIDGIDFPIVDLVSFEHYTRCGDNYRIPGNDALNELLHKLQAIHGAYNFDGSELQSDYFDVNYYGQAQIDWQYRNELEARQEPEMDRIRADVALCA
jgi:hypothetical protein